MYVIKRMTGNLVVSFEYSGNEPNNTWLLEKTYVKARNRYCERVKADLEKLDGAFDFSGKSGKDYLAYMVENMNLYAEKEYASSILYPLLFKRFFVMDDLKFCAELPDGSVMSISVI